MNTRLALMAALALAQASAFAAGDTTDRAKVDKWFRRNCREVLGRECTAREKGDLLAWLLALG